MPVFRITDALLFPPPQLADESGLLGVGGDLSPERLELAYRSGIFPWFNEGEPVLWWSPDPRFAMRPGELVVQRSLAKRVRRGDYRVTLDQAFPAVIDACAAAYRPGQHGTWITADMRAAYITLHERGLAHSVEAWSGDTLVGGLYGVAIGGFFAGESMFAHASDASKVAYVHLVRQLDRWGFTLIDCQVYTDHLARFGATEWPRAHFLSTLADALRRPEPPRPWHLDPDLQPAG